MSRDRFQSPSDVIAICANASRFTPAPIHAPMRLTPDQRGQYLVHSDLPQQKVRGRAPDRVLSNRSLTFRLRDLESRPIVVTVFMWHPPNRGHLIGNPFSASVEEAVHGINCRPGDQAQSKPVLNWAANEELHLILLPSALARESRKSFFQRHRYSSPAIRATVEMRDVK